MIFIRKTPLEKEWERMQKQEVLHLQKQMQKNDSKLNQFLEDKVPTTLQDTLDKAFAKAFNLVFEKGTAIIEKTYRKEEMQKNYQINEYTSKVKGTRKSLKIFSKKANSSSNLNTLISGISGVGLGAIGVGIPDIVLLTTLMLKNIYEIALHFGYEYENENEKRFILLVIEGALSHGVELQQINNELNFFIEHNYFHTSGELSSSITKTAGCLSKELLYMKFLQGIPVVGIVGGAYDFIYMNKVSKYAQLKYKRRFLTKQRKAD